MKSASSIFAVLLFAGMVSPASAHGAIPGAGDFYNGMLHPLLDPTYLLAFISLGLLIGQHAPISGQFALPTFALALIAALAAPPIMPAPFPQPVVLGLVLVAGLLVAISLDIGAYVPSLFGAVFGGLIGINSKLDAILEGLSWQFLAGSALGACIAVVLLGGLIAALDQPWQRIGVRVLGSWTAASAFLVIALAVASPKVGG